VVNSRDHNPYGFSLWLAGGGVKNGMVYGATDDFGYKAVEKRTHIHDLRATILYLLGIDHTQLTYRNSRRDFPAHGYSRRSHARYHGLKIKASS